MFTHLFLDTTQVVNVVDTVKQVVYAINPNANMANLDSIFKNLIAIVAITLPFVFGFVVIIFIINYKFKKDKLRAAERIKMIEKGINLPAIEEKKYSIIINNNGKPIAMWVKLLIGFGAGLFLGMILDRLEFNANASYWSMICLCMGVILLFGDNILNSHKKQENTTLENQTPKSTPSKKTDKHPE